ncbi:TetR/AcrR family transcriptional regulator [Kutzneria buriramensis]|uniref:AcrR family transcriptional regulator n=1 Tax=Kutzneria buriramensis TaxID=1045776 RepID=A0A3E0H768_9PSEU|nr:TetR/AcrR family transcriptional regulator [Kutzneria buriramensis]REH39301.1 AcrR family transcriptional regulator [Kutzneria buriramensis]
MPRLTRAESQTRNREQVLQAARDLFLREGYRATSLAAVADAAGFSTGVVYSNFTGKPELALLVLQGIQAEHTEALGPVLDPGRPPGELAAGLRAWAEVALASGWPRFELEFALDTRDDPRMVAAFVERQRYGAGLVSTVIRDRFPAELVEALPVDAIADAIVDLLIGFAVRRLIDPNASLDQLEGLIRGVLTFQA